jgi:hypothetical protein
LREWRTRAARSPRHDRINGAAATLVRSTVVSGAGDATGIALVEVYEMGFEKDNSLGTFKGLASTHRAQSFTLTQNFVEKIAWTQLRF